MDYTRNSSLAGETIVLRAVFKDGAGNLITPDSVPDVYIYDPSIDSDTRDAEIEAETYASAIAGPLTPTAISTGFYSLSYSIPTGEEVGTWSDVWAVTVNGVLNQATLSFTVEEEIDIDDQDIGNNIMLIVELSSDIQDEDGNALDDTQLFYTTTYYPFYASPDQVRVQVGPWISYMTDEALALLIHWSSQEVDFINKALSNHSKYAFARTMFVVFDTALKVLNQPGAGLTAGYASGRKKKLGDLEITDGTPNVQISDRIYEFVLNNRNEWWRVVNAGGNIVPGESFGIATGIKGEWNEEYFQRGRLWLDPAEYNYDVNAANAKAVPSGKRLQRFHYNRTGRR